MNEQQVKTAEQIEEEAERIATKDTLALVGFVLALIGFLSGLNPYVAWPLDIAGIVFSSMGFNSRHWGTFAKVGLGLAILGFIGTSIIFLIFGLVSPEAK